MQSVLQPFFVYQLVCYCTQSCLGSQCCFVSLNGFLSRNREDLSRRSICDLGNRDSWNCALLSCIKQRRRLWAFHMCSWTSQSLSECGLELCWEYWFHLVLVLSSSPLLPKLKTIIHASYFTCGQKLFQKFSPDPCSNFSWNMYGKITESIKALFTYTSIKIMFFLLAFLAEKQRAYWEQREWTTFLLSQSFPPGQGLSPRWYQHEKHQCFFCVHSVNTDIFFVALLPPCLG